MSDNTQSEDARKRERFTELTHKFVGWYYDNKELPTEAERTEMRALLDYFEAKRKGIK